jgi:Uma2 family endonuclease
MTAMPLSRKQFTPDEYLMIERAADSRNEYLDGEIYAMAGASEEHTIITDNVTREVGNRLKGTPCLIMSQNVKVPAGSERLFAYPDHIIVCGERLYRDNNRDVLINPQVIIEVLSRSTELYDRETKFDFYKQISTFREYILIEQEQAAIEQWARSADNSWTRNVIEGLDATLKLATVQIDLPLAEIYDRIHLRVRPD